MLFQKPQTVKSRVTWARWIKIKVSDTRTDYAWLWKWKTTLTDNSGNFKGMHALDNAKEKKNFSNVSEKNK